MKMKLNTVSEVVHRQRAKHIVLNAFASVMCLAGHIESFAAEVTNGNFEFPNIVGVAQYLPGSTDLTAWVVGGQGFVYQVNGPYAGLDPVDGDQHIGFHWEGQEEGATTLSQSFSTLPGTDYEVIFYPGAIYGNPSASISIEIQATSSGQLLTSLEVMLPYVDFPVLPNGKVGGYTTQTFMFTANNSITTIRDHHMIANFSSKSVHV